MLSKEKNCLLNFKRNAQKQKLSTIENINVEENSHTKNVGDVLKGLDYLSDNIVKYSKL